MGISMHEINSLDDLERALGLNTREGREANREETGCKLLPEAVVEHLKEANKQFTAPCDLKQGDIVQLRQNTMFHHGYEKLMSVIEVAPVGVNLSTCTLGMDAFGTPHDGVVSNVRVVCLHPEPGSRDGGFLFVQRVFPHWALEKVNVDTLTKTDDYDTHARSAVESGAPA